MKTKKSQHSSRSSGKFVFSSLTGATTAELVAELTRRAGAMIFACMKMDGKDGLIIDVKGKGNKKTITVLLDAVFDQYIGEEEDDEDEEDEGERVTK